MIPFYTVLPEIAARETRCILAKDHNNEFTRKYAFVEYFCEDPACDCRMVYIQVQDCNNNDRVVASINYGWEKVSFYRKCLRCGDGELKELVKAVLDPFNVQSALSEQMLKFFRVQIETIDYRQRLERHYQMFRKNLHCIRRGRDGFYIEDAQVKKVKKSSLKNQDRFREIVAQIDAFGAAMLNTELTGYTQELWRCLWEKDMLNVSEGNLKYGQLRWHMSLPV